MSRLLVIVFVPFLGATMPVECAQPDSKEGSWLIKVSPDADPVAVAESVGAVYVEPIESVPGYHRVKYLEQLSTGPDQEALRQTIRKNLESRSAIEKFDEDIPLKLYPRIFNPPDPRFPEQWHLENSGQSGGIPFADLRVRPVWDQGIDGSGVVIGIVDTGTEYDHPDLLSNWRTNQGRDYIGGDNDPSPASFEDRHGTAVTGIAVAASNQTGVIGIAHGAKFIPIRLISYNPDKVSGAGPSAAADALSHIRWPQIDVYNNSWGPSDNNGVVYAPITNIVEDSIINGANAGRGGLGTIYVWAAGNGGTDNDNSNYDGYNSLPYTISVGAVGHDDVRASYSEKGANLLVTAPSQGRGPGILTTDNTGPSGYSAGDVFDNFNGTSAAAPMVAGVVGLMLDKRPDLNWRDVQQILARSASPVDFLNGNWSRNAAGHWVSHEYGFGRVDASAAVALAEQWNSVGSMQTTSGIQNRLVFLSENQTQSGTISLFSAIDAQFVRVRVQLNHSNWGDLRIELISPSGTRSVLSEPHINNRSPADGTWLYLTNHYLGESSLGAWTLEITDQGPDGSGSLVSWGIEIMGDVPSDSNGPPVGDDIEVVSSSYPVRLNVLEGVVDPDGDTLEILSVQHPAAGTLTDLGDGEFEYVMAAPKFGIDHFSVLIADGGGLTKRRLVKLVDPRPITQNDLYAVTRGTIVNLPVLENDYDADGDPLRIISVAGQYAEYATIQEDGTIRFAPPAELLGLVRLKYTITDDLDGESVGWIALTIQEAADVALQFDGVDDYMRLNPAMDLFIRDDITAEAWIYPESYGEHVTGFGRIFDRDTFIFFINGFDHGFYNDRSLVLFLVTDTNVAYAANSEAGVIQLNRWQHVAVSYDSANFNNPVRMYVDGREVSVVYPEDVNPDLPRRPIRENRNQYLYMGESASGARAFKGRMTEFRIWNRELTANQVLLNHDRRLGGNEAGLSLYLPLNQRLDAKADSIGGFNGTVDIFEAQRVPLQLPWADFLDHYILSTDAGNGWWRDSSLGWLYGDAFPWVYSDLFGWVYTGHSSDSPSYELFFKRADRGWMQTNSLMYPWFYWYEGQDWLWHLGGSRFPAEFYNAATGNWESD